MEKFQWVKKATPWALWFLIWQLAALWVGNDIILVGPADMFRALFAQIALPDFWRTIAFSFGKIFVGFFCAFLAGIFLGALSYGVPFIKRLLEPAVLLLKTVPVASFIILALIWAGSENLSIVISFLMVFPVLYVNTLEGLGETDKKLLEMAQVFRVPFYKKIWRIYRPALMPFLMGGCKAALGLAWKAGIAAEVIGVPAHSIGEKLYMAKIYLSTGELFAWTFVIIVLSALFERLFLWCLKKIGRAGLWG